MAYSYEAELNNMKNAQKQAAMADLQATRDKTLSDLQAEQNTNKATYNTQRSTANVQNRLGAKNFQEYLANTGRANSGISAQARLQNQNNLNTSLNNINSAETASNVDIERRRTDAGNAYNSGLASANANIEANYISNLLAQRQKAAELEMQERQFNESVRQFNEQMALQRQQMYSNFRSGRGGGKSGNKKKKQDEPEGTDELAYLNYLISNAAKKTNNAVKAVFSGKSSGKSSSKKKY